MSDAAVFGPSVAFSIINTDDEVEVDLTSIVAPFVEIELESTATPEFIYFTVPNGTTAAATVTIPTLPLSSTQQEESAFVSTQVMRVLKRTWPPDSGTIKMRTTSTSALKVRIQGVAPYNS